jgi:hypothetical protein
MARKRIRLLAPTPESPVTGALQRADDSVFGAGDVVERDGAGASGVARADRFDAIEPDKKTRPLPLVDGQTSVSATVPLFPGVQTDGCAARHQEAGGNSGSSTLNARGELSGL